MNTTVRFHIYTFTFTLISILFTGCDKAQLISPDKTESAFDSKWSISPDRTWAGPEYWANRLQDWQISNNQLQCIEKNANKPFRTVHLLTRRLGPVKGSFQISVNTGIVGNPKNISQNAMAGFLIGVGSKLDYRAAALAHHNPGPDGGIIAAVDAKGQAIFCDMTKQTCPVLNNAAKIPGYLPETVKLILKAKPTGQTYTLNLSVFDVKKDNLISRAVLKNVPSEKLMGNIAVLSHPGTGKNTVCFWFKSWKISGSKIIANNNQLCGPVISTQHTLSENVMKMTAQMMPIGCNDIQTVALEIQKNGNWKQIASEKITAPAYTATFKIQNWDSAMDIPYRVAYILKYNNGILEKHYWNGTVRKDPVDKEKIIVAAFTGNHNVKFPGIGGKDFRWLPDSMWFPHNDIVKHVSAHKPDLLFFSGDQVYEGASPTGSVKSPLDKAKLDYLYKWYLWCWAFRDLARDIPCISIPDDHDVYHGNIWGCSGRATKGKSHVEIQDSGGYAMSPEFVNMVERTQTSNLPDPYDPTPVQRGIGVYYTSMKYGQISFAVVEDRKFKSAPKEFLPEGKVFNGWFQNPDFDPAAQSDVPQAKLLGDRQVKFLQNWAADWSNGVKMKAVFSQTIFANVATIPQKATNDSVVRTLKIIDKNKYASNDKLAADADSDGWPQTGRNKALREMRRGFAVHIAGDQHLGSTIQYGIDNWYDAGFAMCVPSIANFFPRRWFPPQAGLNRKPDAPKYTGDFQDGFGNLITVHAISNPGATDKKPVELHKKAPGYGIAAFNKKQRTITFACWPRYMDPADKNAKPYYGWPVTCHMEDNYGRKIYGYLPTIKVNGMTDPVVQVIDESSNEIVYTLRIKGSSFKPKVFKKGQYTVKVGEPGTPKTATVKSLSPIKTDETLSVKVAF
ncbi:MAG: alkaline phosphatase D family protein [Planctomycetota bacterium]|jgi:phosphodiesterase/alkaline phosphatase D-like protein